MPVISATVCFLLQTISSGGLPAAGVTLAAGSSAPDKRPDDRRIAETILLYQRSNGGWPKNYDRDADLSEEDRKKIRSDREQDDTTFDNGATHSELKHLAKVYESTSDERYRRAFVKGLEFTLAAQYENGGWPQRHPGKSGYHAHITFNDDAMIGVLRLLTAIAAGKKPYTFVKDRDRRRCRAASERGVRCILRCQIEVEGKKTAWCAQHDARDLSPRKARSYELPSISGSESVGIVRYLMEIDRPSPAEIDAIESAVAWFARAKLTGIRVVKKKKEASPKGYDKVVVEDPSAPPLWARFYEIGTDKPIFCSRDGKPKDTLAEISYERRNGYNWLTARPAGLLTRDYPAWKRRLDAR